MKTISKFIRRYKLFSLALLALAVGLGLQLAGLRTAAHWVVGSVAIFELIPLAYGMLQDIRSGRYGIDILASTAIVTAVILHQSWAAIVIVLMLTGGESLQDYVESRAKAELNNLLKRAPQKAHVIRSRKTIEIKVSELKVGDKIVIRPGELVPADAFIVEGSSSFNEVSLTGDSRLQQRSVGGQLLSGSINTDAAITAKVTATARDSQYQQVVQLVRVASESQAPFVRLAERYSIPFTIMAFAVASAVWAISGQAIRFLEVIIVATPCPLLLAAPIALLSGMTRASRYGIIVKNGAALERLADAETIAFDKTGTLTMGQLRVTEVFSYGAYDEAGVLSVAASLEQSSNHVVAQAIVSAAAERSLKLSKTKHVVELTGRGVSTQLKGQEVIVGRLSLLEERGVTMPVSFKASTIKQTASYVAVDHHLIGVILLQDELRPDTAQTLKRLQAFGLKDMIMITGDNRASAQAVAKQLGISSYHADMLPAGKLQTLEAVTKRPLIFVGDGVNDAPALTASDVGIALGARGSTAASESADIIIMTDDFSRVATAVSVAKRTFTIARRSIAVGILLSFALIAAFTTGKFSPLSGAIAQEVIDTIVIFYAFRAHLARGETS